MTFVKTLSLCCALVTLVTPLSATFFQREAHQSHGINAFNDKKLFDFSGQSRILSELPPVPEIGVLAPGMKNASRIFEDTPLSTLMANVDAVDFRNLIGNPRGTGPFNVPIAKVPTIIRTSNSLKDRRVPRSFDDSIDPFVREGAYLSAEADGEITLGDWNRATGKITGNCNSRGAVVRVQLRNALPNGLYTIWDIGVTHPLKKREALSIGPFGGLPNVLVTDRNGHASLTRRIRYCPVSQCRGSKRCSLYLSAFYHFDHVIYGASPTLDLGRFPAGQIASNQLQFLLNGEELQNRVSRF